MKSGYTEIVAILDRSTSMGHPISKSIGGVNQFIKDQKGLDGEASMLV